MHCGGVLFYGIYIFLSVCILFQSGMTLSSYLSFVLIQLWNHLPPYIIANLTPLSKSVGSRSRCVLRPRDSDLTSQSQPVGRDTWNTRIAMDTEHPCPRLLRQPLRIAESNFCTQVPTLPSRCTINSLTLCSFNEGALLVFKLPALQNPAAHSRTYASMSPRCHPAALDASHSPHAQTPPQQLLEPFRN